VEVDRARKRASDVLNKLVTIKDDPNVEQHIKIVE
jgi:hypothetical protein